jgi:fructose/tagatose bisphosphate aldolase
VEGVGPDVELVAAAAVVFDPGSAELGSVGAGGHSEFAEEGSGTPNDTYAAAARGGISKINVNSELRYTYRTALECEFAAHTHEYATVKLVGPVIDAVQAVVEAKIVAFGSAGRSRV